MPTREPDPPVAAVGIAFEVFGVRLGVSVSGHIEVDQLSGVLPPGSRRCAPSGLEATFRLGSNDGTYEVRRDESRLAGDLELDVALEVIERELRALVALKAPAHTFVHAGAVAHRGHAILLPGSSFAGKTTLVAALVRAGAIYYSDEYAPLDARGLAYPFAKPLSLRNERFAQVDHPVDELGGVAGEEPLPVGLIVMTSYEPGAEWRPRRLSPGEAALDLWSNTVPAESRPEEALRAISRCVDGAAALRSARGEADLVAPLLLAELERAM